MAISGSVEQAVESTKSVYPPVSAKFSATTSVPNTLVTIYLQMMDWSEFRPVYLTYLDRIKIMCLETPDVGFYRFLYNCVGQPWRDRKRTDEEIEALLTNSATSIHVLYVDGAPAGYIELARHTEGRSPRFYSTQIVYFGLRQGYIGRGLGKHLLSHGIAYAWNNGTQRLWVHTCNLDSRYALQDYIKCGFKVYRVNRQPMPEEYFSA